MTKRELLKKKALESLKAYCKYADEINVHQKPTEGVNSGAEGRAFERSINFHIGLYDRSMEVRKQGIQDTAKYIVMDGKRRMLKIEDKTGCGTISILNENGDIISSPLRDSDFVIYCPRFYPMEEVKKQCFIVETSVFLDVLMECGLIRRKPSGYQQKRKKAGLPWYNDVESIQSYIFKNSHKKRDEFLTKLAFESLTFDDFIEYYNIQIKN